MMSVLRAYLGVLVALAILCAHPISLTMAAPMAITTAEQMDASAASHDCALCEKEKPSPAKTGCMQNFCAAPCIITELVQLAGAHCPVLLSGSAAKLYEWREKPLVSPA